MKLSLKSYFYQIVRLLAILFSRSRQLFPAVAQIKIILGFVDYVIPVTTAQLCCIIKAATDST